MSLIKNIYFLTFIIPLINGYIFNASVYNESTFAEGTEFIYASDNFEYEYYSIEDRLLGTNYYSKYNKYQNQPYVANGLIGSRIPNLGFGFTYDQNENNTSEYLSNGWPLFNKRYSGAFISGFYDSQINTTGTNFPELLKDGKGYESIISTIPQWTNLKIDFKIGNKTFKLDPSLTNDTIKIGNISNYNQELDMNTGIVTTSYDWLNLLNLKFKIIAHRSIETLGLVQIDITPLEKLNSSSSLSIGDLIDFNSSQRCFQVENGVDNDTSIDESAIYMIVQPSNIIYRSATIYSILTSSSNSSNFINDTTTSATTNKVSKTFDINLNKLKVNNTISLYKYVGIVSDDYLETNSTKTETESFEYAKNITLNALDEDWDDLINDHIDKWDEIWGDSKIQVTGSDFLTLAAESSLYHLLTNTRSNATGVTSALGVSGQSSDSYGGMVFWDADLWVLPALIPFAPEHAISISQFRDYLLPQSQQNAIDGGYSYGSAVYSWTSGRFGNCTGTGPCFNYEYHLNVAISYSIWKLYLSGSIDDDYLLNYGYPIIEGTAKFFSEYVKFNETLGKYTTHNLTDPDEYANFKNNGAYTNAGISQLFKWAILLGNHLGLDDEIPTNYTDIMENMYLPKSNENITLEYTGMNSSISIKQADVVLITYPLDEEDGSLVDNLDYDLERAQDDLTYYSIHQSSQGPAMTFPVFSAVANKLNDYGCGSQTYLFKSIEPFIRGPFAQLSEQNNDDFDFNGGTHPAFPFLTGNGGILQGFVYGLTNLRFSYKLDSDNSTILPILKFDPVSLPLLSGDLIIEGIKYQNESLNIIIDEFNATIISKGLSNNTIEIYIDARNEQVGGETLLLEPGTNLTIPLYFTQENLPGSLTECSSFSYPLSSGMSGDIIDSIIDGDNSTTWQAKYKDEISSILIDLQKSEEFSNGLIVWGDRLALNFSVFALENFNDDIDDSNLILELFLNETSGSILNNTNYNNNITKFDNDDYQFSNNFTVLNVVESQSVNISSPWINSTLDEVEILELNSTSFEITNSNNGDSVTARYILLEVYGVLDDNDKEDLSGCEIAEFALFK